MTTDVSQKSMTGGAQYAASPPTQSRATGRPQDGDPDDLNQASVSRSTPTNQPNSKGNGRSKAPVAAQFAVEEVAGQEPLPGGGETITETGVHAEVGMENTEAGEEYLEATPEQLAAAESGEESAASDLLGIEGYEAREASQEGTALQMPLRDAGASGEAGQEEFFGVLAALVPTLISSIGPSVAKSVMKRLSPRVKRVLHRLPRPVGAAVGTVVGAVKGKASGGILSLVAKLLESAEQAPGGESGMEVDEAFIGEAVLALESIIGIDERVRLTQTGQIPWRRICALRIQFPSGATYRGTGFLIGPRAVATAGHCVYLHNQGGWARSIEVIPGCNGTQRPLGQATATMFRSVGGWVTSKKPESDYGCVILPPGAFGGRSIGSFGFAAFTPAELLAQTAVLAGYPGDKPFAELWGMSRVIKAVSSGTLMYDIDTMGGQSGAPVYIKRNGNRYVIGIHNYGSSTVNSATRITQPVYDNLLNWSKIT